MSPVVDNLASSLTDLVSELGMYQRLARIPVWQHGGQTPAVCPARQNEVAINGHFFISLCLALWCSRPSP